MLLFGDLVMKCFCDDEVTIRIGLDVDESEARFIIVLEMVSDDRSIWISGCCFCAGCCSLFLASVSLVCAIAASFAFCSNADVLFFVGRMVFLDGESAFLFRSVRGFLEFRLDFLLDGPAWCCNGWLFSMYDVSVSCASPGAVFPLNRINVFCLFFYCILALSYMRRNVLVVVWVLVIVVV